ncbi:MAG TPA: VOC family protein [Gaiellaceae bacterium]|nr:VOC family protein [Gaiellaceae bacterium]
MIDHVSVNVSDADAAKDFYEKALAALGYSVGFEAEGMAYFADAAGLSFGAVRRDPVGGAHVGFAADDRATVDAFYEAAIAAGGTDNGAPGLRPDYGEHYYGAYVLDLDGNNIEAVCHGAE